MNQSSQKCPKNVKIINILMFSEFWPIVCSYEKNVLLPLQSFFTKKVSFGQCPNVLLVLRVWLLHGDFHLTPTNNKEGITSGTLPNDVVTMIVKCLKKNLVLDKYPPIFIMIFKSHLFQDIRNFDKRFVWQVFEYWNTGKNKVL